MSAVTILCTDPQHPIYPYLRGWAADHASQADTQIIQRSADAQGGDILFLVSCHEIIKAPLRDRYHHTLVIHASDLPNGRGMSPHVWQILDGSTDIVVTLLEAAAALDAGDIWHQETMHIPRTALHDEIHAALFETELRLMSWALQHHTDVQPRPQSGTGSFYRKRNPGDSQIPLAMPIGQAFALLRIADPQRYPAFIEVDGVRFKLLIERM